MTGPIKSVRVAAHQFSVELSCGMTIDYPLESFHQLENAKAEELKKIRITKCSIIWPALGVEISLDELLQIYWNSGLIKNSNQAHLY